MGALVPLKVGIGWALPRPAKQRRFSPGPSASAARAGQKFG